MKSLLKRAVFTVFLFCAAVAVFAANPETDFFYELTDDQAGLVILAYYGDKPNVVIPDVIEGFDVLEIGECAFAGDKVSSVYIPESITTIHTGAFAGNRILKNINIPKSVTSIGAYAFYETKSLNSIQLPDSLVEIGEAAFFGSGLTSITFPANLEVIPKNCCSHSRNLKKITYSKSLKTVHNGAFAYCSGFTDLILPPGLSIVDYPMDSLDNGAFYMCNNAALSLKKRQAIKATGYKGQF